MAEKGRTHAVQTCSAGSASRCYRRIAESLSVNRGTAIDGTCCTQRPLASIARTERTDEKAEGQQKLTVHTCVIPVTAFSTNERIASLGDDACQRADSTAADGT